MEFIFFLSLPLYALDQLTKQMVLRNVQPDEPRIIVHGFLHLVTVTNTGAAVGSFKDKNTFFVALSCCALLFVLTLLLRRRTPDGWRDVSLALLSGGLFGILPIPFF